MENKELDRIADVMVCCAMATLCSEGIIRPFCATLNERGEIALEPSILGRIAWPLERELELLTKDLQSQSISREIRAIGICTEICAKSASQSNDNVLHFVLEHEDGDAVNAYLPYRIVASEKSIEFGEPSAVPREPRFFMRRLGCYGNSLHAKYHSN